MKNFMGVLLIALLPSIISCGFSPAYQEGSNAETFLEQIYFDEPAGELEFLFLDAIERKIQNSKTSNYLISYSISVSELTLSEERVNVNGRVNFTVKSVSNDTIVFDGSVSNFVGYTVTGSSSFGEKNDAFSRLIELLADSVRIRLIALGNTVSTQ